MTAPTTSADLALVLSGGGARAAYQVGVLAAIAERRPQLSVPILSGVSAGAINTTTLAAHPAEFKARVDALRREWSALTVDQVYHVRVRGVFFEMLRWLSRWTLARQRGPAIVRGVMDMEPLRVFLEKRVNLRGIALNIHAGRLQAVSLSAMCYTSNQTITFVQGASGLKMWERAQRRAVEAELTWEHVMASAAIPIFFPAVRIGDGFYGDGSVRQAAPLAPAVHLGARKIMAVGMKPRWNSRASRQAGSEYPTSAQVMGILFHSIFLDTLDADAERLERYNALLSAADPQRPAPQGLRPVRLLVIRPSVDIGAMARPHWDRLPPIVRTVVQSIGGAREGAADFVSYLLFDPSYTHPLMELGYDDAVEQWDSIERFLDE